MLPDDPTLAIAQEDIKTLFALSQLIDKVKINIYMCTEAEEQDLNTAFRDLMTAHVWDADAKERFDAVVSLQKAVTKNNFRDYRESSGASEHGYLH